ncbi:MAG: glycoside hydrolase family 31 protein [Planctomycetota bacterium]
MADFQDMYVTDVTLLTDDRRIFHRADFEYDEVAEVLDAGYRSDVLTCTLQLETDRRMKLSVEAVGEGVFRLKAWRGEAQFDETSPMLAADELPPQPAECRETELGWLFTFGDHSVEIGRSPFVLRLIEGDGRALWQVETDDVAAPGLGCRRSPEAENPFLSWRIRNDERLFGMGEKWNSVEKTGTRATIWEADTCGTNTTDLSYKAVPVLFSTRGWGMALHSAYRSFWEIGNVSYVTGSFLTEDEKIDLFLFAGDGLKDLLGKYTALTGRPEMPPKWAMGVWLSRCQYTSRQEAEQAARGMREREIPCDVVHIDPKWMKVHYYPRIGVDACDFDWNEEDFPEPEQMFRRFAEDGFKVCLWINPYLPEGTDIYEEAAEKGYLVKAESGEPARNEHDQPVGMVDWTNREAKEWWKGHLKELLRLGAAVFKPDYGERVPGDCLFANGRTGAEMHNLFLLLYNRAVYEATVEETGERIIWGRSGYIGSQRYPGTWAGDTQVDWRAMKCCLRGGLSAGMTGWAFWSHDIGGFTGPKPEPELYVRWAQWGLLSPLSRFHGTTPREPWEYGEEAERIVGDYCRLRYRLIPYLLASAGESCRTGLPIMRHLALEFPDEPNVHTLDDQYMLGPDLLAAPVLLRGARSRTVYLPAGRWFDFHDPTEVHQGPGFAELAAPLERMPLLVREGAVIPMLPGNPQHLKDGPAERIDVDVYAGERERCVRWRDEDVSVSVRAGSTPERATFHIEPAPLSVRVRFLGVRAEDVKCEGAEAEWRITDAGTVLEFDAAEGAYIVLTGS